MDCHQARSGAGCGSDCNNGEAETRQAPHLASKLLDALLLKGRLGGRGGLLRGGGTRRIRGGGNTRAEWVDGGHGRIETRRCVVMQAPAESEALAQWPRLKALAWVEAIREINGKASVERRYYISSRQADAGYLGPAAHGHWGVENNPHWSLDVAYGEDQARMREGNSAENFSTLRRITLNLIRLDKARKTGINNCRLKAGWSNAY